MISDVALCIFLKFSKQIWFPSELPIQPLLCLWPLETKILKVILNNRQAFPHQRPLLLQYVLLGLGLCLRLLVRVGLEVQVRFAQLLLEVHTLWLNELHLVPFLHDLHHFLDIVLRKEVVDHLDLALVVQDVLLGQAVEACSVVYFMELDDAVVGVGPDRAPNEVAESKPLAAFRAKLWLVVS